MSYLKMTELDLNNKRVMIRADLNVPIQNGKILSDQRLQRILPTLRSALEKGARILLLSHLDRPKEGEWDAQYSLEPIAERLSKLLNHPIRFEKNWLDGVSLRDGDIVLGENVRFNVGEKKNDPALSKKMAALCDVFVMDAFATAHRSEASTVGVAQYAKVAAAGPLLVEELEALAKVMQSPKRPLVAIVGGAKVSSKLLVLKSLLNMVDSLILGGGIANTFCKAVGVPVGKSLVEDELLDTAKELLKIAEKKGVDIILPVDGVVAESMDENAKTRVIALTSRAPFASVNKAGSNPSDVKLGSKSIQEREMILDVGENSLEKYRKVIEEAGTILWNGPVGVFEMTPFMRGTEALSKMIATSKAFSVAGGGETLAAIDKFGVEKNISYMSTGGGAFLEFIEGKTLPAVSALEERAKENEKI